MLAWGVVVSLGLFLVTRDAGLLFHGALASLVLAQLADYAAQITLFRTAV